MLITSILSALLLLPPGSAPHQPALPAAVQGDTLHCRVEASAHDSRRCSVRIPKGRVVRGCSKDRPEHCTRGKQHAYAAWVVAGSGARCKISGKRTKWRKRVTMAMRKSASSGAGSCDLYVVLR